MARIIHSAICSVSDETRHSRISLHTYMHTIVVVRLLSHGKVQKKSWHPPPPPTDHNGNPIAQFSSAVLLDPPTSHSVMLHLATLTLTICRLYSSDHVKTIVHTTPPSGVVVVVTSIDWHHIYENNCEINIVPQFQSAPLSLYRSASRRR